MFLLFLTLFCALVCGLERGRDVYRWRSPHRIRANAYEPMHEVWRSSPLIDSKLRSNTQHHHGPRPTSAAMSRARTRSPATIPQRPMSPLAYNTLSTNATQQVFANKNNRINGTKISDFMHKNRKRTSFPSITLLQGSHKVKSNGCEGFMKKWQSMQGKRTKD